MFLMFLSLVVGAFMAALLAIFALCAISWRVMCG